MGIWLELHELDAQSEKVIEPSVISGEPTELLVAREPRPLEAIEVTAPLSLEVEMAAEDETSALTIAPSVISDDSMELPKVEVELPVDAVV